MKSHLRSISSIKETFKEIKKLKKVFVRSGIWTHALYWGPECYAIVVKVSLRLSLAP